MRFGLLLRYDYTCIWKTGIDRAAECRARVRGLAEFDGIMKNGIILSVCAAILLAACVSGGGEEKVRYDDSAAKGFMTSEIVADIVLVPLQTSDGSMVSERSGVICHDGDYIVYGPDNVVKRFDASGRFLNDMGNMGDASDEYLHIGGIGMKGDTLCVKDVRDGRCRHYSLDGDFISSHVYSEEQGLVDSVVCGDVTYKLYSYDHERGYRLAQLRSGETERTFLPVMTHDSGVGGLDGLDLMCAAGDEVYFTEFLSDRIMSVSPQGLKLRWTLDMGPYAAPKDAETMSGDDLSAVLQSGGVSMNAKLHVSERYMILLRTVADEYNTVIYMVRDSESGRWNFIKSRSDDAFGGMPCFCGDEIIFVSPARKVLNLTGPVRSDSLAGLDDESNSVIIRVKLK